MHLHVVVHLSEKPFLHRRESLPIEEERCVSSRYGTNYERSVKTGSTADSPYTDEIRRDSTVNDVRKAKKGNCRDSWTDDESFFFDQSKLEDKIDSQVHVIRPFYSLYTDALNYRTYRQVIRDQTYGDKTAQRISKTQKWLPF